MIFLKNSYLLVLVLPQFYIFSADKSDEFRPRSGVVVSVSRPCAVASDSSKTTKRCTIKDLNAFKKDVIALIKQYEESVSKIADTDEIIIDFFTEAMSCSKEQLSELKKNIKARLNDIQNDIKKEKVSQPVASGSLVGHRDRSVVVGPRVKPITHVRKSRCFTLTDLLTESVDADDDDSDAVVVSQEDDSAKLRQRSSYRNSQLFEDPEVISSMQAAKTAAQEAKKEKTESLKKGHKK